jgi:hypothetical protein
MKRPLQEDEEEEEAWLASTNVQLRLLERQIQRAVKRGAPLRRTQRQLIDNCLLRERDLARTASRRAWAAPNRHDNATVSHDLIQLLCGQQKDLMWEVLRLLGPLELFMLARVSRQLCASVVQLLPRLLEDFDSYVQQRSAMDPVWRQQLCHDTQACLRRANQLDSPDTVATLNAMGQLTLHFYLLYRCERNALVCTLTDVTRAPLAWELLLVYNTRTAEITLFNNAWANWTCHQTLLQRARLDSVCALQQRYNFDVPLETERLQQCGQLHQLDFLDIPALQKVLCAVPPHRVPPCELVCADAQGPVPLTTWLDRRGCVLYTLGGWQMERYYRDHEYRLVDYYECRLYINLARSGGLQQLRADNRSLICNNPRLFLKPSAEG